MAKINHIVLALIGALFSIVPIYNFLGWTIISIKYSDYTHEETVRIYLDSHFNWFNNNFLIQSLISILFGVLALLFLIYSLKTVSGKFVYLIKIIVLGATSFSTFMALWWLM